MPQAVTPILLPGNMCDERLWPAAVRHALPGALDADLSRDDSILGMAQRALALCEGPILPVGLSMGGNVALAMHQLASDRIAGLILLDANASADLPERAAHRPRQQSMVRAGRLRHVVVEELKPNYLAARNRGNQPLLELLHNMAERLGPDVFVQQSEALRTRPDLRVELAASRCPVLIAGGAEDRLCPPEWQLQWQEAAAGRAHLHVLPGAGHMVPLEQPEALAGLVEWWLQLEGLTACRS